MSTDIHDILGDRTILKRDCNGGRRLGHCICDKTLTVSSDSVCNVLYT